MFSDRPVEARRRRDLAGAVYRRTASGSERLDRCRSGCRRSHADSRRPLHFNLEIRRTATTPRLISYSSQIWTGGFWDFDLPVFEQYGRRSSQFRFGQESGSC